MRLPVHKGLKIFRNEAWIKINPHKVSYNPYSTDFQDRNVQDHKIIWYPKKMWHRMSYNWSNIRYNTIPKNSKKKEKQGKND